MKPRSLHRLIDLLFLHEIDYISGVMDVLKAAETRDEDTISKLKKATELLNDLLPTPTQEEINEPEAPIAVPSGAEGATEEIGVGYAY